MKLNTKNNQKIIKISICAIFATLSAGCGSFSSHQIETEPEVVLHELDTNLPNALGESTISRVGMVAEEKCREDIIVDPSMDIENEFFLWATEHVKTMENMQISFFSSDFYGFHSGNNSSEGNGSTNGNGQAEGNGNAGKKQSISSNVSLSDSERAWLSVSVNISEADVLAYKSMAKGSMEQLDYYYVLFHRANCEMSNYRYECAKAIYDSDPARYTPKDYYDSCGNCLTVIVNDREEALIDTLITYSTECAEAATNQVIAKYGAQYAADYLRLIGVY